MELAQAYILKMELREKWGDKPCSHLQLEQEHDSHLGDGNWFCLMCGRDIKLHTASPGRKPNL